jgi:hypothetical protein
VQHLDPASYRAVKLGMLHASPERAGIDHAAVRPLRVVPPHGGGLVSGSCDHAIRVYLY